MDNMDSKVHEMLKEGENLLWSGKPANVKALDKTNKTYDLTKLVISLVLMVILSVLYIVRTLRNSGEVQALVVILIVIIFGFIGSNELLEARKMKGVEYYLTNMRLISLSADRKVIIPLSSIDDYKFTTDADGNTSLRIGKKAYGFKDYKLRNKSTFPPDIDEETGKCSKAIFYSIPDIENFRKIFEAQLGS